MIVKWRPKGPAPQVNFGGFATALPNVLGLVSGRCQALAFSDNSIANRGLLQPVSLPTLYGGTAGGGVWATWSVIAGTEEIEDQPIWHDLSPTIQTLRA